MSFDRYNQKRSIEEAECSGNLKTEQRKKSRKKERKVHLSLLQKSCIVNETTQTSRATSNTSNSNFNANIYNGVNQEVVKRKIL